MRTATAYFAGVGTVVVAIAAGLGGGLTIANITSPHDGRQEVGKVERRNAPEPTQVSNAASEPVSYLAATQAAATKPVTVAPAPQQNAAPAQANNAVPPADANAPRDSNNATANSAAAPQPAQANAAPPAANSQPAAAPEDANARARDADVKNRDAEAKTRDVDTKRAAAEKRRAERRQQWAERRHQPRRGDDLRDVELRVREATDTPRLLAADPERMESPRIRLFDDDV